MSLASAESLRTKGELGWERRSTCVIEGLQIRLVDQGKVKVDKHTRQSIDHFSGQGDHETLSLSLISSKLYVTSNDIRVGGLGEGIWPWSSPPTTTQIANYKAIES